MRGCDLPLAVSSESRALRCERRHAFDVARDGSVNLLQPQDRRSRAAGDAPEAVAARGRWIERGLLEPLAAAIRDHLSARAGSGSLVVDAGCGEGRLLRRVCRGQGWRVAGIDLSPAAIRAAAARKDDSEPGASRYLWIVANADRRLPVLPESVDLVLSLHGRRNAAEFHRILRPGGAVLAALPGPDDLLELRAAVLGRGERRERGDMAREAFSGLFSLQETAGWEGRAMLDRDGILDALRMSYRGERRRERDIAASLDRLEVTLSAELLVFEKREAGS